MTLLQIRNPPGTLRDKLGRIDVVFVRACFDITLVAEPSICSGNTLVLAATSSTIIALTWGGVSYLWSSWRVLVPLLLGLVGLAVFFIYEAKFALHPVVCLLRLCVPRTLTNKDIGALRTFVQSDLFQWLLSDFHQLIDARRIGLFVHTVLCEL
jgi:hypothetical protein